MVEETPKIKLKQYCHEPLSGPRSTRVLELQPAADISAPICCSLKAISLDDYPQWQAHYTALSYTWDGQTPSCEVNCDGSSLLITPNCDAAMRQLRSPEENQILWIDSICIDQRTNPESLAERSYHVALMGEIYKSAAKVVVWLGGQNELVKAAINRMIDMVNVMDERRLTGIDRPEAQLALREYAQNIAESKLAIAKSRTLPWLTQPGVKNPEDDPFRALFECSWFYRMWTIQEVSLAFVDRILVRCGALEVPWHKLVIALDALKTSDYKWGRWKEATSIQKQFMTYLLVRRIPEFRAVLDGDMGTYHNDPLVFDILTNTQKKLAGDPKDKVLALYGLFRELEVPFPSPDYSLSVEDIYREATAASIRYDKNLYILYHVPSDQRREGLASWVPDWSAPGFEPEDSRYGILRDRFAASGPSDHTFSFSADNKALILRGKVVDTVIYKAASLPDNGDLASTTGGERRLDEIRARSDEYYQFIHDTSVILKTWVEVSKWGDYPTGEPSKEALQRTLVADYPNNNALAATGNCFNDWYDAMGMDDLDLLAAGLQTMDLGIEIPLLTLPLVRQEFLRSMKAQISDQMASFLAFGTNRFNSVVLAWSAKRCFFYTEHEYFGTAPDPLPVSILPDDKIAIVSGLEMPLVLRPVEGGYRLITHVYVHGMMYGEMWPEAADELEDIALL